MGLHFCPRTFEDNPIRVAARCPHPDADLGEVHNPHDTIAELLKKSEPQMPPRYSPNRSAEQQARNATQTQLIGA